MRKIDTGAVARHVADAAFGKPLVQNNLRGMVVEAMIDLVLPSGWRWVSLDWAAWDFEHADGTRLEIKQSSAKQTWSPPKLLSDRRFDIAPRTGRWDGADWIADPGRFAHMYTFGDHPVADETADHRDPMQWDFYVVPTVDLPPSARSISIKSVRTLVPPCTIDELPERVEAVRSGRSAD